MRKIPSRRPRPALVISLIALFVALGGTTYAATTLPRNSVGTKQLQKNAVTASKIMNGAVTARKVAAPEAWHEVGATGEPSFQNGWTNDDALAEVTAGFYKDPFGVVHLKGLLANGTNGAIFALPLGYRPGKILAEVVTRNAGTVGTLEVGPAGYVIAVSGTGVLSLDGVTFRAGE